MTGVWRGEDTGPCILGLGTGRRTGSALRPDHFVPGGNRSWTLLNRVWADPRDCQKVLGKRKICCYYQESSFDSSTV